MGLDGLRTCRHCLWDIACGPDGKWHLAWGDDDISDDDECEHEPRADRDPDSEEEQDHC